MVRYLRMFYVECQRDLKYYKYRNTDTLQHHSHLCIESLSTAVDKTNEIWLKQNIYTP